MPVIICTPLRSPSVPISYPEIGTDGIDPVLITLKAGTFVGGAFTTAVTRMVTLKANAVPPTVFETDPTYAPKTITLKANAVPPTVFETDPTYTPKTITLKARGIAS